VIQPCPCCGQPVIVLPSGQLTTQGVVGEVADLIDLGDEMLDEIRTDPDIRANVGEFFQVEDLDED
jgi:hypothetical protein